MALKMKPKFLSQCLVENNYNFQSRKEIDFLCHLPRELLDKIANYLSEKDIKSLIRVSTLFRDQFTPILTKKETRYLTKECIRMYNSPYFFNDMTERKLFAILNEHPVGSIILFEPRIPKGENDWPRHVDIGTSYTLFVARSMYRRKDGLIILLTIINTEPQYDSFRHEILDKHGYINAITCSARKQINCHCPLFRRISMMNSYLGSDYECEIMFDNSKTISRMNPFSLKELARANIAKHCSYTYIQNEILPLKLKDYINQLVCFEVPNVAKCNPNTIRMISQMKNFHVDSNIRKAYFWIISKALGLNPKPTQLRFSD